MPCIWIDLLIAHTTSNLLIEFSRLGLTENEQTFYYILQSTESIDEVIHARLKEKMKQMRDIIESDLPGSVPGYWSEDLGEDETLDLDLVEQHVREILR